MISLNDVHLNWGFPLLERLHLDFFFPINAGYDNVAVSRQKGFGKRCFSGNVPDRLIKKLILIITLFPARKYLLRLIRWRLGHCCVTVIYGIYC